MGEGLSRKQAQQQSDAERWESMGKPCLAKHGNIKEVMGYQPEKVGYG